MVNPALAIAYRAAFALAFLRGPWSKTFSATSLLARRIATHGAARWYDIFPNFHCSWVLVRLPAMHCPEVWAIEATCRILLDAGGQNGNLGLIVMRAF